MSCGCPIWDLPFVPARYGAQLRGRLLGPQGFSLPLTGVMAHARPAERPPPGGHSPASHAGDAPGGTQPGAEHALCDGVQCAGGRAVVLVWLVCKVAGGPSRTPATCQGRGPPNQPPPAPLEGGRVSCLGLWCLGMGFRGFSRITGGAGRRRLFRAFVLFSGFLYAFDSLAGAFDSPCKRGTSRYGSDLPPKRASV
jgi:hypothetical protein